MEIKLAVPWLPQSTYAKSMKTDLWLKNRRAQTSVDSFEFSDLL